MLEVRYATAKNSDYEAFMKLHKNFRYAEENPKNETDRELVIKDYQSYKNDVENTFFAVLDGEIIGYAVMSVDEEELTTCKIEEIYVRSDLQRHGYGRRFVREIIKVAKEENFKKITLISANLTTDKIWFLMGFKSLRSSEIYEFEIK